MTSLEVAIEELSQLTGIDCDALNEPLQLGYSRSDVTELYTAFLKKMAKTLTEKTTRDIKQKNTRAMITFLRNLMPHTLRKHPTEVQLDTVQCLLEILGFDNTRRFPLFAYEAQKPILADISLDNLTQADRWLAASHELLEQHYLRKISLNAKERLGILCIYLSLHAGVTSRAEMQLAVLELFNRRIRRKGDLIWISSSYEKKNDERCRQWLVEEIVLLASGIDWQEAGFPTGQISKAIGAGLLALVKRNRVGFEGLNRTSIIKAGVARGFFLAKLPAFILGYMQGEISSSALPEPVIARLLNVDGANFDINQDQETLEQNLLSESVEKFYGEDTDGLEHTAPTNRGSVITQLSSMLYTSSPTAKDAINAFILEARARPDTPGLIDQILEWCSINLKRARPKTVKTNLDGLMARLISAVGDLEAISDPDHWAELVEQMTVDLDKKSKSISAISSFARYLTMEIGEEFVTVGSSASYGVNAQVLTAEQVQEASALLLQMLGQELGEVAGQLLKVAFTTGMRRSEIDGLLIENIELGRELAVNVRRNPFRELKTGNARRNIPLAFAEQLFPKESDRLVGLVKEKRLVEDPSSLIFEQDGHVPLKDPHRLFNAISDALQTVTGDKKAKFHSLRHSFCCYLLLSFYYEKLGLSRFEESMPFLKEIKALQPATEAVFRPAGAKHQFELATTRGQMGHLSETTTLAHYFHFCDLLRYAGFSSAELRPSLSPCAALGAMAKNQNTRGLGRRLRDVDELKAQILSEICTDLPKRTANHAREKAAKIQQSLGLHQDLLKVMACAKSRFECTSTDQQGVVTDLYGEVPIEQIDSGISWLKTAFLSTSFGRELPKPFSPLSGAAAKECLLTMLHNLNGLSVDEVRAAGCTLRNLLSHKRSPYLSFVISDYQELQEYGELLDRLLNGFSTCYRVTLEAASSEDICVQSLSNITKVDEVRYRVKMLRGDGGRFPHRSLIWLTTALTLLLN